MLYNCIDSTKAASLMAYAESEYGILIPTDIQDHILGILTDAHFELIFVLSGLTALTDAIKTEAKAAIKKQLPTFDFDTIMALDQSAC